MKGIPKFKKYIKNYNGILTTLPPKPHHETEMEDRSLLSQLVTFPHLPWVNNSLY